MTIRKSTYVLFVLLMSMLISAPFLDAADWPQWRGPERTGISPETGWHTDWQEAPPPVAWQAPVHYGFSSPIIAGGRVYALGYQDGRDLVHCLDLETGSPIWQVSSPNQPIAGNTNLGPMGTPCLAGDFLYTYHRDRTVRCWAIADGALVWERDLVEEISRESHHKWTGTSSPLVVGDRVIINCERGAWALACEDGRTSWTFDLGARVHCAWASPVPIDWQGKPAVLVPCFSEVACVDAESGHVHWRGKWNGGRSGGIPDPLVTPQGFFSCSGYSKHSCHIAFPEEAGGETRLLWGQSSMFGNKGASGIVHDGYVYNFGNGLGCVDLADGTVRWSGGPNGQVIMVGDHLIVQHRSDRKLSLIKRDPSKLTIIGAVSLPGSSPQRDKGNPIRQHGGDWTTPAFSDGRLVVRLDQQLLCLDCRSPDG